MQICACTVEGAPQRNVSDVQPFWIAENPEKESVTLLLMQ